MPSRSEILTTAAQAVTVDRAATHGQPERNFARIAGHWTWWLQDKLRPGVIITDKDVGQMMTGLKQARAMSNPQHMDNYTDAAGYQAIVGELASEGEE